VGSPYPNRHRKTCNQAAEVSHAGTPQRLSGRPNRDNSPLDLNRFAHSLARKNQQVMMTKYFTARISGPEDKRKRQLA
jgi:hypothetical protein